MKKKAIIISIKGFKLTKKEKKLISEEKPWGLILFKRNIKSLKQLKNLVQSIRKITKDKYFPIMIDEEGGAVTRIGRITKHNLYQKLFGDIYKINAKVSTTLYKKKSPTDQAHVVPGRQGVFDLKVVHDPPSEVLFAAVVDPRDLVRESLGLVLFHVPHSRGDALLQQVKETANGVQHQDIVRRLAMADEKMVTLFFEEILSDEENGEAEGEIRE